MTSLANISSESPCIPIAFPFGSFLMQLTTSSGLNDIGGVYDWARVLGRFGVYSSLSGWRPWQISMFSGEFGAMGVALSR